MKKALFLLALICLFSGQMFAQKNDVRKAGESITLDFKGTYLIQSDTSETGVITIVLLPTEQIAKELESKLAGLQGEVAQLEIQRSDIDALVKDRNSQIKELMGLIEGSSKRQPKKPPRH